MTDEFDKVTNGVDASNRETRTPRNFYIAIGAVAVAIGLALGAIIYAITTNQDSANQAHALAVQIQQERRRSIRENCESSNKRNRDTLRTLDEIIERLPPGFRRNRAKENRAGTKLLIDALAPYRDCDAVVERQASNHLP